MFQIILCLTISRTSLYLLILIGGEISEWAKYYENNQIKVSKHAKRRNLRYHNVSKDANASRIRLVFLSTLRSCSSRFLRALKIRKQQQQQQQQNSL